MLTTQFNINDVRGALETVKMRYVIAMISTFVLGGILHYSNADYTLQFIASTAALLLAAGFLGKATESVAYYAGQRIGGFLNATFGNAAELIISFFLIREGLFDMVKASITGAIIGNLLLVLGLSLLLGGIKHRFQRFNRLLAEHNSSLMFLSVIALIIPASFVSLTDVSTDEVKTLSLIVAGILIVSYGLWLLFSMITHKGELNLEPDSDDHPFDNPPIQPTPADESTVPPWTVRKSIVYLLTATAAVAFISDWLVGTLETLSNRFGLSELFVGAFIIAIIGNAAEHSAAVLLALKNKMGAAVEIAVGSSLQIALFVAPVLVLTSGLFGSLMDIIFTPIELIAIGVAVIITGAISRDGMTNWFEGVLLLVVYILLGTAFYLV